MVGRTPVRELSPPVNLQPAAAPVDSYVRPATPAPSNLHDLAQGLGSFSSGLQGFLRSRQGEDSEAERLRGEAEFYRSHSGGFQQGVAEGVIPPTSSPDFMRGFQGAQGNVAGIQMRQDFNSEFAAWENRHTASPEEFQAWFGEFLGGRLNTDDENQLRSMLPHVRSLTEDAWGNYERVRGERVMGESITAHLGVSSLTIDEAINQAPTVGGVANYEALWGDLLVQREEALATGIPPTRYDQQLFNTIVAKALEHGDESILGFLDETLPGQDIPIGQQPEFLAGRLEAEGQLARLLANRDDALYEAQERADEERLDQIVAGVTAYLQENPMGALDDALMAEWSALDPLARTKVEQWRNTFNGARGREDTQAILEIEMGILSGMTPAEVMAVAGREDSPIRDPATLARLYARAQERAEFGGQILQSEAYKRYADMIEQQTGTDSMGIFGGTIPTGETIAAMRDLEIAAIQWMQANPNASLVERERAMDEIGQMITGRITQDRQYLSQEDFTAAVGESERQAPRGIDRGEGVLEDRRPVVPGVGNPALQSPDAQTQGVLAAIPSAGDAMLQQEALPSDTERFLGALEAILPEGTDARAVIAALQEQTGIPMLDDFQGVRDAAVAAPAEEDGSALTPFEIYNSEEPPSMNALSPELRQRIEQHAEELGVTPEEMNMQFWQRIRERFFNDEQDEDAGGVMANEFAPPSEPIQSPGLDAITEFMERAPSSEELVQFRPRPAHDRVDFSGVNPEAMQAVQVAGAIFGRPLDVTSAYRSQEHQDRIRSQGDPNRVTVARSSWHTRGLAFDFPTRGMDEAEKARLVGALADAGFTGFGEYSGHIHADMRPAVPNSFGGRGGNWGGWTALSPAVMGALRERGFRAGMSGSRIDRSPPWDRVATNNDFPDRPGAPTTPRTGTQRTRTAAMSDDQEVKMLAPVLDLIALTEGTGRPGSNDDNYNETLAYGQFTGGDVDLVNMTLDEVDALQTQMLRHPQNRMNSSAVGRYQFIRTTLREMRRVYNIPGDMKFTPEFQDWLAIQRMRQTRGLDDWQAGRLSTERFVNNLSQEWASLPRMDGRGTYRGQRVGASAQEVVAALQAARGSRS